MTTKIQARADFLIPSMAPLGMSHRAIVHRDDGVMEWRWCRSLVEAREWLRSFPPNVAGQTAAPKTN